MRFIRTAALLVTAVLASGGAGCTAAKPQNSNPQTAPSVTAPATSVAPGNGVPEDPALLLKGQDLGEIFRVTFTLTKAEPRGGQGVMLTYVAPGVTLEVTEIKGEEAAAAWKQTVAASYRPGNGIGPNARLEDDRVVVYRGTDVAGLYVEVFITTPLPADSSSSLEQAGKRAAERMSSVQ